MPPHSSVSRVGVISRLHQQSKLIPEIRSCSSGDAKSRRQVWPCLLTQDTRSFGQVESVLDSLRRRPPSRHRASPSPQASNRRNSTPRVDRLARPALGLQWRPCRRAAIPRPLRAKPGTRANLRPRVQRRKQEPRSSARPKAQRTAPIAAEDNRGKLILLSSEEHTSELQSLR